MHFVHAENTLIEAGNSLITVSVALELICGLALVDVYNRRHRRLERHIFHKRREAFSLKLLR